MIGARERKILFASWHFYLDGSNGAAVSTRSLLLELARRGWEARTFCALAQDFRLPRALDDLLAARGARLKKKVPIGDYFVASFEDRGIESLVLVPNRGETRPTARDADVYSRLLRDALARFNPDWVATYGGYALGPKILEESKKSGAKTAVFLHNLAYRDPRYFQSADRVFVPSEFAAREYRERLGLETVAIPPLISLSVDATEPDSDERDRVLFVNPEVSKGIGFVAALARELAATRPEIRFLIVEGSAGARDLWRVGKDELKGVKNVDFAPNAENIAPLCRRAKITLVPSLVPETFGRTVAESALFGVPVVASTRGALPETLGAAGVLIDIPEKFTPDVLRVPTREEIAPWIDAVVRLWDDKSFYREKCRLALERAKKWSRETVGDRYENALYF
ncbi:MAG: glycosyltransferase [Thermoguttaceae bacterium]|nr:glycosyltransferase [Thermoguttaceae bacterium]